MMYDIIKLQGETNGKSDSKNNPHMNNIKL